MHTVDTIYLIHHSHTDVGYTSDQPVVWDVQERFIDEAIDLVEKYCGPDHPVQFRWTVESTVVLERWLKSAASRQIERLVEYERAGLVEITGMFANITPLYDADQLIESVQSIGRLRRDYGFNIRHAMNCDVNGESWALVDVLLDAGLRSFSMAVNSAVGGFPFKRRPFPFWWQGPSGRSILAHLGFPYDKGWTFGIGRDAQDFAEHWWPTLDQHLSNINYPLSAMLIQSFHPFGDNGSAYEGFVQFIETWNRERRTPRLVFATPSMWVDAVAGELERLPRYSGDWTDYWNFGCASSAREQRINRASRDRLRSADALHAATAAVPTRSTNSSARSMQRYRAQAWWNLNLWDEHTWGSDNSIWAPHSDDTASQWNHKAQLAYQARSLSLLLQRDGLGELAKRVQRMEDGDVLVFNPLPWTRKISGPILNHVIHPRGGAEDATAGRHFADHDPVYDLLGEQMPEQQGKMPFRLLEPLEVPGYGYTVVPQSALLDPDAVTHTHQNPVLENSRFRVTLDMRQGGIASWYDKQIEHEWVNPADDYGFNRFLYEQVAGEHPTPRDLVCKLDWSHIGVEIHTGWKKDWPALRRQPDQVVDYQVLETPLGQYAIQHLKAPGCAGILRQSVFLPNDGDYIEVESAWEMGVSTDPDAVYLPFHINLSAPSVRLDLGGQSMQPGTEQLPGSCADYYTVQRWVDFNDGGKGLVIATPDAPMIMLGGFHLGDERPEFELDSSLLLGWVANTYWMTNFRAHQPGQVRARYRLMPYTGQFDEPRNHRFGAEAAFAQPLAHSLGEGAARACLAPSGSLLQLPDDPILTLHVKQAEAGDGLIVRLYNPTDAEQVATICSGQLQIQRAWACDIFENVLEPLEVKAGSVTIYPAGRRMVYAKLEVRA